MDSTIFIAKCLIESVLAIRDVGIQVKTVYWGGSSVSRFINRLKIDDIIINEGISFWQIKSYMAILVKDEDKMVVIFEVNIFNNTYSMATHSL